MSSTTGSQSAEKPKRRSSCATISRRFSPSGSAKSMCSKTACRQLPARVPPGKVKIERAIAPSAPGPTDGAAS